MFTVTIFIQHSYGSPCHGNQRRKREKIQIGKISKTITVEDIILYIEHPKDSTRKLEVVNEFGKVSDYKNLLHSYTLIMKYQKEKLGKQYHLPLHQKE